MNLNKYLTETDYLDYSQPAIVALVKQIKGDTLQAKAVSIYYLVRDSIRYNPYIVKYGEPSLKASHAVEQGQSYCIPKAGLMVALCRAVGIPARLGLADVRNHLSSDKFIEMLGTDYFAMHGYVEVWLDDVWIKATPVFNKELCEKFNVEPLDWDGKSDAIIQAFTRDGKKHMDYLKDHGCFDDVPVAYILENFKLHYPKVFKEGLQSIVGESFEQDMKGG